MIRKNYIFGVMILIAALFLVSCTNIIDTTTTIPENKLCSVDMDCVPASCCHATDAVNKGYAPKCEGMLCTMECVPKTLDCSQGEMKCLEKECQVVFKE